MQGKSPVLTALAQARARVAPMFAKWCDLNGAQFCPARPADVARFVVDCASLGIERLWRAVQDISDHHVSLGLADPTLGPTVAAAISDIADIDPPRSWSSEDKQRFKALPYDVQLLVATQDRRREKALRRAQNDAAAAERKITELRTAHRETIQENHIDEASPASRARAADQASA